ncbi:MAG: hemolysin XhlA family protein [Acidobacteriota bacterium]|nr:hemolysin XhlA family protein [Acidobacteriota bacterium]
MPIVITLIVAAGNNNKRFDDMNRRFDGVEKRLDRIEDRLERIETKLDDHGKRIAVLEERTSPLRR